MQEACNKEREREENDSMTQVLRTNSILRESNSLMHTHYHISQ